MPALIVAACLDNTMRYAAEEKPKKKTIIVSSARPNYYPSKTLPTIMGLAWSADIIQVQITVGVHCCPLKYVLAQKHGNGCISMSIS